MRTTASRRRVSPEDYRALEALAGAPTSDAARARIVLAVLGGLPPATLARQAGVPRTTVYSWVRRFAAHGVAGLCHRSSHGSPIGPARAGTVVEVACPGVPLANRAGSAR
jgi:transposase-like protein